MICCEVPDPGPILLCFKAWINLVSFSFQFAIAIEIQNLKEETKDDSVES